MYIRLVFLSQWPLKLAASLLYVLLEGDRLYPGGTRCSRHKWSEGTNFLVTDGPGGRFIPDTDGPGGPLTRGTVSSMTDLLKKQIVFEKV